MNLIFPLSICQLLLESATGQQTPPNIIFILADDLGWNDVGFHGSNEVSTPNIDTLAYDGIILNNYYVNAVCTPSRTALMTGMYPIRTGLQTEVIYEFEDRGVPLEFQMLPQYLNKLGYRSHAIGKWHLGHSREAFLPLKRGFMSHYGYWLGMQDYYMHSFFRNESIWGYDFRDDMQVNWDDYGEYATDLFSKRASKVIREHDPKEPLFLYLAHLAVHSSNYFNPLQAPREIVDKFAHIQDAKRRKFAAMLYKLDESVGRVVNALEKAGMLGNSIIIFSTDNGGPAAGFNRNQASNWPLRGVKNTLFEGGVRGSALLWSPLLQNTPRVETELLMGIHDWLPTLYHAAGGNVSDLPTMDGKNAWNFLQQQEELQKWNDTLLHNTDGVSSAIRVGPWKYITSTKEEWSSWYGPDERNSSSYDLEKVKRSAAYRALLRMGRTLTDESMVKSREEASVSCHNHHNSTHTPCNLKLGCLFFMEFDPCEKNDLSQLYPDVVEKLKGQLGQFQAEAVAPTTNFDTKADPK